MKNVLLGLLKGLGGWLLVAAALGAWLLWQHDVPASRSFGVALGVGALWWVAFWLVVSSLGRRREMRVIASGGAGVAPVDGRNAVLVGVIEPLGPLLRAPLDRSPCVAYSYEVRIDRGSGKNRVIVSVARGVALTPSRIVTRTGSYKLLVVPDLEAVASAAPLATRLQNFLAYADTTTFIEGPPGKKSARELLARWADDDGHYRSDVRFMPTAGANTTLWLADQQHVPPGASVCVFGRYSHAKGGIVPTGLQPVRLVCGSAADVVASLRSKVLTRAVIAVFLGAGGALLWANFMGGVIQALGPQVLNSVA